MTKNELRASTALWATAPNTTTSENGEMVERRTCQSKDIRIIAGVSKRWLHRKKTDQKTCMRLSRGQRSGDIRRNHESRRVCA